MMPQSRSTKRRRDEEQTKTKQNATYEITGSQTKEIYNKGTALERSAGKLTSFTREEPHP